MALPKVFRSTVQISNINDTAGQGLVVDHDNMGEYVTQVQAFIDSKKAPAQSVLDACTAAENALNS